MKADRILFRDGVLQREAKILFTEPGGPWNTVIIYESDDPRKNTIGKIREDRRHYLLTIDGVWLRSEGIVKGAQTQCKVFKKLQDAKDFATEVFSSVGKDWMEEQA
jgi:hypothetical protein